MTKTVTADAPAQTMTAVEAAKAAVTALATAHQRLCERQTAIEGELAAARTQAAIDVLDGTLAGVDPSGMARHVAELDADLTAVTGAIAAAETRQRRAAAGLDLARAAELRQQAADLRQQAANRKIITDRLVADLRAHEGVDYVPFVMQPRADGTLGEIPWLLIPELGNRWTQTGQLLSAAAVLENQAQALEAPAQRMLAKFSGK